MAYLDWRRRKAFASGEGYGEHHLNEPVAAADADVKSVNPLIAVLPLVVVGVASKLLTLLIPAVYGEKFEAVLTPGGKAVTADVGAMTAIWAVEGALLLGILVVVIFAWRAIRAKFAEGSKDAVAGALLAGTNTASEYGFGAVIAALPGFLVISDALKGIPNPLIKEAVTVTTLAGVTGSASGGMSIALGAMADQFIAAANAAGIPLEVLHRVAAMASGGMDTLPHNGAVITLLAVTGLTHVQAYKDIFAITCIKTLAVAFVIGLYYATGWV
jgi:H+/gluconate symporter-like permease